MSKLQKRIEEVYKKLEAQKTVKGLLLFIFLFLILNFFFGFVVYNGFFFGVSSSATYLMTYNLGKAKTWETFKANHTQIDPQSLDASSYLQSSVQISDVGWIESATRHHDYFSFQVSFSTNFEVYPQYGASYSKGTLKQPSFLILLLDQTDRIRGKLYSVQGSADFIMNGNNRTEAEFWFKIPDDVKDQPISIIVEVFGIMRTASETDPNAWYDSTYKTYTHNGYYDAVDDVYGSIPAGQSRYLQTGYVNLDFVAYDRAQMHTPTALSILDLTGYTDLLALAVSGIGALWYLTKDKTKEWWKKNKVYVVMGFLFLVTYIIILIIVGVLL